MQYLNSLMSAADEARLAAEIAKNERTTIVSDDPAKVRRSRRPKAVGNQIDAELLAIRRALIEAETP